MKGMYSGNEDWLSRQRWIPIVLVAVAVLGGWAIGSQRKQGVADKDSEVRLVQPMTEEPQAPEQAPKQAAPKPGAMGTPAPPPARGAKVETISAVESHPTTAAAASTDKGGRNLGDAARRAKQHKACLELAKNNPSILCR
jgi:hypothetical protein